MALIKEYGEMWARNSENIESIPGSKQGGQGAAIGIIKPKKIISIVAGSKSGG